MKRTTTTVTYEYDNEGNLLRDVTETVVEEDNGYINPQQYPVYPTSPITYPYPTWIGIDRVTCDSELNTSTKEKIN